MISMVAVMKYSLSNFVATRRVKVPSARHARSHPVVTSIANDIKLKMPISGTVTSTRARSYTGAKFYIKSHNSKRQRERTKVYF